MGKALCNIPLHNKQQTIDLKGFAPGLYYLSLKGNNGMAVKRITVAP